MLTGRARAWALLSILFLVAGPGQAGVAAAQESVLTSRLFWGGNLGVSTGDVDYVEVAPFLGLHVTPRLSAGVSVLYRYRSDNRFDPDIDTSDYGGSVFARHVLVRPLFLHAEYEVVNFEYVRADRSTTRDVNEALLLGGGVSLPVGRRVSATLTALYNVLYDSDARDEPYDSPWVVRVGVTVGF